MPAQIYLGTQGWSYKDWVGPFYPPGTKPGEYLSRYAEVFDAVELDTTFYATPRAELVDTWRRSTPDDFRFTAKLPRSITHDRHLVDSSEELQEFLRAIELLGPKLGAVLIQLPPDFTLEERPALEAFLDQLPEGYRFAAEFRHRSWVNEDTYELLRAHGVAWAMLDLHYMPRTAELTSDFTYVRWLGDRRQIERMHEVQIDRTQQLDAWAERLDEVARKVQTIFGFANNHYSGHSPSDIRYMRDRLGLPARRAPEQGTLL